MQSSAGPRSSALREMEINGGSLCAERERINLSKMMLTTLLFPYINSFYFKLLQLLNEKIGEIRFLTMKSEEFAS